MKKYIKILFYGFCSVIAANMAIATDDGDNLTSQIPPSRNLFSQKFNQNLMKKLLSEVASITANQLTIAMESPNFNEEELIESLTNQIYDSCITNNNIRINDANGINQIKQVIKQLVISMIQERKEILKKIQILEENNEMIDNILIEAMQSSDFNEEELIESLTNQIYDSCITNNNIRINDANEIKELVILMIQERKQILKKIQILKENKEMIDNILIEAMQSSDFNEEELIESLTNQIYDSCITNNNIRINDANGINQIKTLMKQLVISMIQEQKELLFQNKKNIDSENLNKKRSSTTAIIATGIQLTNQCEKITETTTGVFLLLSLFYSLCVYLGYI